MIFLQKKSLYFILITAIFFAPSCKNETLEKIKPEVRDITEFVYASVSVKPEASYFTQPLRSGVIKAIHVEEGDSVKVGQLLFEISPSAMAKNQVTNSELDLEEARANYLGNNSLLNNIELEINTLQEQLALDSINFKRQERLWSQNIGKKIELDQSKLKYQSSLNQLNALNQKLAQTRTTLLNNYKKAISKNETGRSDLADYSILSKINGKVYSIQKEVGDFISTQEPFAELGSAEDFKLEMDIDEVDITKIELGDSVLIALDAFPEEIYVATVHKIFPKKDEVTQTFRVESTFTETPPKLYYGLAGEANIIVSKRKNTLVIPTEYLMPNNKVLTEDGEQNVKLGLKNLKFVEVLSGLDSTTNVLKPTQ